MHDFRGIQNPWRCHWSDEIQKKGRFFSENCAPDLWVPGCHTNTLIDFANTALVSKGIVKLKCMISEGYRTHGGITAPMNFKKMDVFFRKIVLPGFWDPGCHPINLIDLVNTALARKDSEKNICMISDGYKAHRGVTGPMNFKKLGHFFSENCAPGFSGLLAAIQAS